MSNHNNTINFSHSPYKTSPLPQNIDHEIKMGEFRLRYVQLMRDIQKSIGEEAAADLINESNSVWEKLIRKY